ncbi:MAG: HD domain-containing protein [Romboutsia sp.]
MNSNYIFNEVEKILLESNKPSVDIKRLIKEKKFNIEPFNKIKNLENIDQNKKYHPEGNVLNHILLVVDEASKNKVYSKDKRAFMWGALLHDIGKLTTTKIRKGRITSYDHDIEGENISYKFLDKVTEDENLKRKVSKLVRYHMQPLFFDKNLPFFDEKLMLKEVDFEEVALLSMCDRLGRGDITKENIEIETERISKFKEYCKHKVS